MYEYRPDRFVNELAEPVVAPECTIKPPTLRQDCRKVEHSVPRAAEDSFLTLLADLEAEYASTGNRSHFASRYHAWIDRNSITSPMVFVAWFNLGVELNGGE